MSVRIVLFAKAPLPGLAKTRLIPALGALGAAELARRMLKHAVTQALAAEVGPVELCVTPFHQESTWQSLGIPAAVTWSDQGEGDPFDSRCSLWAGPAKHWPSSLHAWRAAL